MGYDEIDSCLSSSLFSNGYQLTMNLDSVKWGLKYTLQGTVYLLNWMHSNRSLRVSGEDVRFTNGTRLYNTMVLQCPLKKIGGAFLKNG